MGWGNICKRRLKVFTLAVLIYLDYKAVQKRVKWANKSKSLALWERTHERNARRVLKLIIELNGLWVKLGQYLSTRADVLPEAYIVLLRQLQDSLPPRPLQEVQRTIQSELGKQVEDLFENFCEEPLATASIAQVHRATLKDGQEVVVKVQHEGIKDVILDDLKNAKSIVDWIAWAEPQYNFNPMIDEWCKEAPKELDFNNEAENTRTVSKNLRGQHMCADDSGTNTNHVDVLIPEVIQSSEKVLVLEFMDGIRLNDNSSLEAAGIDKQKVVEEITRAYCHQIYVDGFFNADPHPGNFLISNSPPHRPILLDFGLTKSISNSMKQALAKMFLASAEGDHVALLSAFAEMGLKLRLDMPEQVMDVVSVVFRSTTPANEAAENVKQLAEQRARNMKIIQEKMKLNKKEMSRFNPVDAFPGDAVLFFRVLHLLRGLSSTLNVRIIYMDIMRPFAESTLRGTIMPTSISGSQWIHDSKIHSDVEAKLRQLLLQLGREKILGIQVCAYKDGKVIIDTAAGVLGKYDPRPVQPDTLFNVFSATKGITAGMLHWLADKGKLKFEETVSTIWPDFGMNHKEQIKVHHVLNHTSGLSNALADVMKKDPLSICDWDESLSRIAMSIPGSEPGLEQQYHYLSFGWLCGGIIEYSSGKKFQKVLEEAIVHPLNIEGELYIGIPAGVESRLATLTLDKDDIIANLSVALTRPELPSSLREGDLMETASGLPVLFNTLNMRRAIIPAANGHCSARALARYYAALARGGVIPPAHNSHAMPPLGRHLHIPEFLSSQTQKNKAGNGKRKEVTNPKIRNGYTEVPNSNSSSKGCSSCANGISYNSNWNKGNTCDTDKELDDSSSHVGRIFTNSKIHDAFMGVGDYAKFAIPNGKFGLGFRRFDTLDGKVTSFGHSGIGGSTGFCDIEHDFAIAVTLNKMSFGGVTRSIIQLVCSELNIPVPQEYSAVGERGPDMQLI